MSMNPADLITKQMPRPNIEQLMNITGDEFMGQHQKREELHGTRLVGSFTDVKKKAASVAPAIAK